MKILFFVGSMNAGGAERVAAALANAWVQERHEVYLVPTFLGTSSSFYELDQRVHFRPLQHEIGWFPPFLTPLRKWRALRKIYKSVQPDVVVSFLTNVNVNVLIALKGVPTPIIVCERTHPVISQSASPRLKKLRSKLYPRASRVVVQTADAAQAFAQAEPALGDIAVLPNPIANALMEHPLATQVEKTQQCQLVAMGRLVPSKQFDQLIQAFAMVAESCPEWTLHIYGEGPERAVLEQRAELAGVKDRVFFPGKTNMPWQALTEAQLFVLTSAYEGFPNVLLEAMSLGLPCITVNCPSGPAELSNQGHDAVLISTNDPSALEQALVELMSDARLRGVLGRRAATSVRERFSMDQVLELWDRVFQQAGVKNTKG